MMKRVFYGWWITLACSLIGLYVAGAIFFGFTTFFEPIAAEFAWSYTQISFAISLRGLEMGIFAPLVGFLADYFGPRKVLFGGVITTGAGLILLGQRTTAIFPMVRRPAPPAKVTKFRIRGWKLPSRKRSK